MTIFITPRLIVRKLCTSDLDLLYQVYGDEKVMSQIPLPALSLEETKAELEQIIHAYNHVNHRLSIWCIFTHERDQFVVVCASIRISAKCRDIGYRIKSTLWGNGYGTEVTNGIISYLKSDPEVKTIQASVDDKNEASIKILKKFMKLKKKEYDPESDCWTRYYELSDEN